MWLELKRIIKPNGAVVLFGQEPFSSFLRMSNTNEYKYDWYWRKSRPSGFVNSKLKPLKDIEVISVFSSGATANGSKRNMPYHPQGLIEVNKQHNRPKKENIKGEGVSYYRKNHSKSFQVKHEGYPRQVLEYGSVHNGNNQLHPTQKPVALMEYLIKTYTNEDETVLDFTFGSCSTGVAAVNTNRKFIGIEMDDNYFDIGVKRISEITDDTIDVS